MSRLPACHGKGATDSLCLDHTQSPEEAPGLSEITCSDEDNSGLERSCPPSWERFLVSFMSECDVEKILIVEAYTQRLAGREGASARAGCKAPHHRLARATPSCQAYQISPTPDGLQMHSGSLTLLGLRICDACCSPEHPSPPG